jgi:hypothetical protein
MERPRQLFRDFGLALALLLAAVLLYWRSTLPALQRNRDLDREQQRYLEQGDEQRAELERLRAEERATGDPIEIERVHRRQHGDLGLPANERAEPLDDEPAAAPASGPAAARR